MCVENEFFGDIFDLNDSNSFELMKIDLKLSYQRHLICVWSSATSVFFCCVLISFRESAEIDDNQYTQTVALSLNNQKNKEEE